MSSRRVALGELQVTILQEDGTWRRTPLAQSYYVHAGRTGEQPLYEAYHHRLQRLLYRDVPHPHMPYAHFQHLIARHRCWGAGPAPTTAPITIRPDNEITDGQHRCAALYVALGPEVQLTLDQEQVVDIAVPEPRSPDDHL